MRAILYTGNRAFRVEERPQLDPGPADVRLEVAYVGICGTDLHIKHGEMDSRVKVPAVIGHEMSGTVVATGRDVLHAAAGDRVTVMPLLWCDRCPACLAGNRHICQNLVFVGIDSPGALQQSWTVPERLLVKLPDGVDLRTGALAEPLSVAVHDVRRGAVGPGDRVLVVGAGPIGILIACVARAERAEVLLSEPNAFRRSVAAGLGLQVVDPSADDVVEAVEAWTHGAGADVAFEVSASPAGLACATRSLRVRGRLVCVGIHGQPVPVDLFRVFWRELEIFGARVYERRDFERAVEMLASGEIPADRLISSVVPLERTPEAFEALENNPSVVKLLIDCQGAA